MKTVDLESLCLTAFRSFVDRTEIPLGGKGLVLIRGINTGTGGGSRVGKSSINLGIAYALGYSPFPATELQSWLTEEKLRVELGLRAGDQRLLVERGVKGLKLSVDGLALLGGVRSAEERLKSCLGLSPDMLAALTYRQQRSDGTFLSKTNTEMQEFLTLVLGLTSLEEAVATSQERLKTLEVQTLSASTTAGLRSQELESLQNQFEAAPEVIPANTVKAEQLVAIAEKETAAANEERAKLLAFNDDYTRTAQREIESKMTDVLAALETSSHVHLVASNELHTTQGERGVICGAVKKQQEEIRRASATRVCPTCKRAFENDADAEPHRLALDEGLQRLVAEEHRISDLVVVLMKAEEGASLSLKAVRDAVAAKRRDLSIEVEDDLRALAQAATVADAEQQRSWQKLREAQQYLQELQWKNEERERRNLDWRHRLEALQEAHRGSQEALQTLQGQVGRERDFMALTGKEGFLGAIFDEVLAEIAVETNYILARVPNVADVTLGFRSESLTAKGATKKAIVPVVTIGGHETAFRSGCSGGMLAAIYLAVDLAVIEVVSRRLGVAPGWLILDESFEGLGVVEKEAYLEVLCEYARTKLILVVDHSTETKEGFRQHIDLVFDGNRTALA